MNGILLLDKPSGWTSFDAVAKIRGILRQSNRLQLPVFNQGHPNSYRRPGTSSPKVKVGHTGTLDPLATGLLVLVLGNYCKRAAEFSKLDKAYEVDMTLGKTSTTGDEEGKKTVISSSKSIAKEDIEAVLSQFTGEILQTPPIYSAIKVNGQRAYKLARAGKEVKLEPRQVNVYGLQLTAYRYPEVKFTAKVSSGTYIRSLVEDIGKELGTGAYMNGLKRSNVGQFELSHALQIDQLDEVKIAQNLITLPEQSK